MTEPQESLGYLIGFRRWASRPSWEPWQIHPPRFPAAILPRPVDLALYSMSVHSWPWPMRAPARATCEVLCEQVPGERCLSSVGKGCGLYAAKLPSRVADSRMGYVPVGAIEGAVALWGHVVEHEHGFRAEYAYPLALLLYPIDWHPMFEELYRQRLLVAEQYGIPVVNLYRIEQTSRARNRKEPRYGYWIAYSPPSCDADSVARTLVRALETRTRPLPRPQRVARACRRTGAWLKAAALDPSALVPVVCVSAILQVLPWSWVRWSGLALAIGALILMWVWIYRLTRDGRGGGTP